MGFHTDTVPSLSPKAIKLWSGYDKEVAVIACTFYNNFVFVIFIGEDRYYFKILARFYGTF